MKATISFQDTDTGQVDVRVEAALTQPQLLAAPAAQQAAHPAPAEVHGDERAALERLTKAVEYELDPDWGCESYHPSLAPALKHARAVLDAHPQPKRTASFPELTSKEVNDACWTFIEAMPHALPGPIWNDLKPALYATLKSFAAAVPCAAVKAEAPQMLSNVTVTQIMTLVWPLSEKRPPSVGKLKLFASLIEDEVRAAFGVSKPPVHGKGGEA